VATSFVSALAAARDAGRPRVFAHSKLDAWLTGVAFAHGAVLSAVVARVPHGLHGVAAAGLLGLLNVYTSNTVSHCHLHKPIFASKLASRALSLWLTIVLFVPQTLWMQKHFWHHAGEPKGRLEPRITPRVAVETGLVAIVALAIALLRPSAMVIVAPGFALGMLLCHFQGIFEHAGDELGAIRGTSHYGTLYNLIWFNDGHHAEHHSHPRLHWTVLPQIPRSRMRASRHAPLLRFLDDVSGRGHGAVQGALLGWLERCVLAWGWLHAPLVACHKRAFRLALGPALGVSPRVLIVGGALFPRTILVLRELAPEADVAVIDTSRVNLDAARRHLQVSQAGAVPRMLHTGFDPELHCGFDIVVFPLAFVGPRSLIDNACRHNRLVVTHDWLFRRTDRSVVVAYWLFKRLNVHRGAA
jgi:hypothetical protein